MLQLGSASGLHAIHPRAGLRWPWDHGHRAAFARRLRVMALAMLRWLVRACLVPACLVPGGAVALGEDSLLQPGDRLALVGGTVIERLQESGLLEVALHQRRPEWKLSVRNLGWSGDDVHGTARKGFGQPADGWTRLCQDIQTADPTVVLIGYGWSEASDGPAAVSTFESGLRKLVTTLQAADRRAVLVSPVAMPGYRVDHYRQSIETCRRIIAGVAEERNVPSIPLRWQPQPDQLTPDGLLPNRRGYAVLAEELAAALLGSVTPIPLSDEVQRLILEKNQLFFHRYRPQNETYLFLFRQHEQGNNAVEIPQFDPLIRAADEAIWRRVHDR